jgi:hypothetical protein
MVIASVTVNCPVCGTKQALHHMHESFFGVEPKKECVVCIMIKAIDQEWPQLYWRNDKQTFAVNAANFRRGT